MRYGWMALALLAAAGPIAAQEEVTIPDPATVEMPDLSSANDPALAKDGWMHFYFQKPGVSYEKAYRDIADCYRFLPVPKADGFLPAFVPWDETPGKKDFHRIPMLVGGPVGEIMLAMVSGPIERRARQSRMRRCLEPRGYVRYPLSEDAWAKLIDRYSLRSIALQAKAASAPAPKAEVVTR